MNKLLLILLMFSFCLMGCNPNHNLKEQREWFLQNEKIKVLTTTAMISDLVKQVGGDRVDVIPLIQGQLDPHSYELVKGDDEKFAFAQVIFYNGLGLEHGLSLRQNLQNNPKAFSIGDPLLKEDPNLILIVDGQYDPHIWMDIALWMRTVKTIVATLSIKDPMHAEEYKKRGEVLLEKMKKMDEYAYVTLQGISEDKRYLVTSHDAFNYFARHYLANPDEKTPEEWNARFEAPEGLAPDAQLSVSDIQAILRHVKKYKIRVLFPESNVSKDSLKKILNASHEQGMEVRISEETLYGDAMGEPGSNAESYLGMLEHNVNVIAKELKK